MYTARVVVIVVLHSNARLVLSTSKLKSNFWEIFNGLNILCLCSTRTTILSLLKFIS